jgi:hypothetical protein
LNVSSNAVVIISSGMCTFLFHKLTFKDKPIVNLQDPVIVSFTMNNNNEEQQPLFCGYRENITIDWKNDNTCQLEVNGNQSICNCTKLGQVTVFTRSKEVSNNISEESIIKGISGISTTALALIIVGALVLIVAVGILIAFIMKRKQNSKQFSDLPKQTSMIWD